MKNIVFEALVSFCDEMPADMAHAWGSPLTLIVLACVGCMVADWSEAVGEAARDNKAARYMDEATTVRWPKQCAPLQRRFTWLDKRLDKIDKLCVLLTQITSAITVLAMYFDGRVRGSWRCSLGYIVAVPLYKPFGPPMWVSLMHVFNYALWQSVVWERPPKSRPRNFAYHAFLQLEHSHVTWALLSFVNVVVGSWLVIATPFFVVAVIFLPFSAVVVALPLLATRLNRVFVAPKIAQGVTWMKTRMKSGQLKRSGVAMPVDEKVADYYQRSDAYKTSLATRLTETSELEQKLGMVVMFCVVVAASAASEIFVDWARWLDLLAELFGRVHLELAVDLGWLAFDADALALLRNWWPDGLPTPSQAALGVSSTLILMTIEWAPWSAVTIPVLHYALLPINKPVAALLSILGGDSYKHSRFVRTNVRFLVTSLTATSKATSALLIRALRLNTNTYEDRFDLSVPSCGGGELIDDAVTWATLHRSTTVTLDGCGIKGAVSSELGRLTWIVNLNMSDQGITQFPESLAQMTLLKDLDISDNKLTVVPTFIKALKHLEALCVANNRFAEWPTWLGTLRTLGSLNMSGCLTPVAPRRKVPAWLRNLPKLHTLVLFENDLDVPDEAKDDVGRSPGRCLSAEAIRTQFAIFDQFQAWSDSLSA